MVYPREFQGQVTRGDADQKGFASAAVFTVPYSAR